MADLLRDGMSWLADGLHDQAAQTVTYRRGADTASPKATFGSQLLRTTDGRGNTKIERTERDFIIRAADLVLGGAVTTPRRGDWIDVTFGDVVERFEVMSPTKGEAPWRYSDPYQQMLRVHTKFVGRQ